MPGSEGLPDETPRRAVTRIMARDLLNCAVTNADLLGLDMVGLLVFTGIWTSNTEHLTDPGRYSTIFDLPPNSERRPMPVTALAANLRMPLELVRARVDELIQADLVEEGPSGLIVPSAVFTRREMLDGVELLYTVAEALVAKLARYGVSAGR